MNVTVFGCSTAVDAFATVPKSPEFKPLMPSFLYPFYTILPCYQQCSLFAQSASIKCPRKRPLVMRGKEEESCAIGW